MNKFKLFLLILPAALALAVSVRPASAFNLFCTTDSSGNCVSGVCKDNPKAPTCQQAQTEGGDNNRVTGSKSVINTAADILAIATGIGAVIMIIISGLTLVTSAGNAESINASRRRIMASLLGLVVVALAWVIIRFVTDKLIQ